VYEYERLREREREAGITADLKGGMNNWKLCSEQLVEPDFRKFRHQCPLVVCAIFIPGSVTEAGRGF
jgi:hypothetical protein